MTPETEPCPYCRATSGVQSTPAPPRAQAWSCTACRTDWAITAVNPRPYFDRLSATVEQLGATRSVLRQVITLADDAATLSDSELRDRLLALAARARLVQRTALTVQESGAKRQSPRSATEQGICSSPVSSHVVAWTHLFAEVSPPGSSPAHRRGVGEERSGNGR